MAPTNSISAMAADTISEASHIFIRAGLGGDPDERPASYKVIGICLAVASGLFIGVSFIFSKIGLLKANEKYSEIPGQGYGYLKNAWWWTGMLLMAIGEICNFVAFAFTDAILVACLGALSVVVSTVLSAIFLKERLSAVGIVGCVLCILGSVNIALNIPSSSAVKDVQEMKDFVLKPGILSYGGVIILGCIFIAVYMGPRYGNKNVLVYLSICSLIGGLSVVATQGLGSSILAQINGKAQFKEWFMYALIAFVIVTLAIELLYLNKALNIFNAALVTPTYYVCFTSATIITSAILFRGFKGTPVQIITIIMSFLTIVAGVVLLQLSKSAKDVPDAAVFSGDLNQIRTIAEQEQPETEPKADALRGTASIIRRLSQARQKMELEEARRLHDEMAADHLAPVGENEGAQYEWDGLRRRRTTLGSHMTARSRPYTPRVSAYSPHQHPPLGMSYFPADYDQHNDEPQQGELRRPSTEHGLGTGGGGFLGSLRDRARSMVPGSVRDSGLRSPMHPLPLTEIESYGNPGNDNGRPRYLDPNNPYQPPNYPRGTTAYDPHEEGNRDTFGNFSGLSGLASSVAAAGSAGRQSQSTPQLLTAERPGKEAKRQFSFTNFFHRSSHHDADQDHHTARLGVGSRGTSHTNPPGAGTEEERAGLVKGDSASDITGKFPEYVEHEEEERKPTPPPKSARMDTKKEKEKYEKLRAKWEEKELGRAPTWEKEDDGTGGDGRGGNGPAYI